MTNVSERASQAGERDVRRAWLSFVLFPVSFLGAFGVGAGLVSLFGYSPGGSEDVPVWVMFAAGGPALLVLVVPALLTVVFARRAERAGNPAGRVPMWIAVGLATAFVLLNVVQGVLSVVLG